MFFIKSLLCVALAVAICQAEVIDFKSCNGPEDATSCTIHEVRINPCPQAATHTACQIRRRKPAAMSFDYTPHFDATTMEFGLSWLKSEDQELPLNSMDRDACKFMSCPLVSGQRYTSVIDVPIESKFPLSSYTIKWTFTAPNGKRCCFTQDIKVVR